MPRNPHHRFPCGIALADSTSLAGRFVFFAARSIQRGHKWLVDAADLHHAIEFGQLAMESGELAFNAAADQVRGAPGHQSVRAGVEHALCLAK